MQSSKVGLTPTITVSAKTEYTKFYKREDLVQDLYTELHWM